MLISLHVVRIPQLIANDVHFFVLNCSRSGTTMFALMLNSYHEVCSIGNCRGYAIYDRYWEAL